VLLRRGRRSGLDRGTRNGCDLVLLHVDTVKRLMCGQAPSCKRHSFRAPAITSILCLYDQNVGMHSTWSCVDMRGALVGNRQDDPEPSVLDEVCEIYENEYGCTNMGIMCRLKQNKGIFII